MTRIDLRRRHAVVALLLSAAALGADAQIKLDIGSKDGSAALVGTRIAVNGRHYMVAAAADARYPHSGRALRMLKLADDKGAILPLALDEAWLPADPAKLAAVERELRRQALGALDDALPAAIEAAGGAPLPVLLWPADLPGASSKRPKPQGEPLPQAQIDETYAANDAKRAALLAERLAPLLKQVQAYDPEARLEANSPMIAARLNADALKTLAQEPGIDRIYLETKGTPELRIVKQATGITSLALGGATGRGIRVAMVNAGGGLVEPNSLLLRPVVQDFRNMCLGQVDPHATSVGSVMVARRLGFFNPPVGEDGAAPNIELRAAGSCATLSTELFNASTRAADWGARAINLSWGLETLTSPGIADRFYDDLVFNRWRTVVKSSGNRGCLPPFNGDITTPGLAFNVITVGGFDHNRSATWNDDLRDVCASSNNPVSRHADREKPELAAPSVNIEVVTAGPANTAVESGTSLAAPLVTATAALMMERNGRLAVWPEITRAVLMAAADHNIEGASRLSKHDGAGGLNAYAAIDLLAATNRWNGVLYSCGTSTPNVLTLGTVSVGPRTRQRIVLSWTTDPSHSDYGNQPSADIDLTVVDSLGRTMASSMSFDNTYEIVEFDSWQAGTYTVQARKYRCDRDTWLGWAWHTLPIP